MTDIAELYPRKVSPEPNSGCWLWEGQVGKNGYGTMWAPGQGTMSAHRFSWGCSNGFIPEGLQVCHKCDVKLCVNPEHLFLGTQQDNVKDMFNKGRDGIDKVQAQLKGRYPFQRGTETSGCKLTEEQVREIRASKFSPTGVAKKYGISPTTVAQIRKRTRWGWLK